MNLALLLVSLAAAPVAALDQAPVPRIDVHAELQNATLFRNDSDFDRTPPEYNANGQTVGFVGTILRPSVDLHVWRSLRLHYDAELGLNFWSMHDPDVHAALAPGVFVLKHRQIYAEGELADRALGFRIGYSRFIGPTGLFANHWIGNAQAWWAPAAGRAFTLFAGQIPEGTFEGVEVEQNNFTRDSTLFGLRGLLDLSDRTGLDFGIEAVHDAHEVERVRLFATPSVRLDGQLGGLTGFVSAALQVGRFEGETTDAGTATLLAWALQAQGRVPVSGFEVTVNLLALSPDDDFDGNTRSGAFLYSGKSTSSTVMLTEDEILDWRGNVDERMSSRRGGFWQNRAGLTVADVKAVWAGERYRPGVIVGAATALNPSNALGSLFVGAEADLVLEAKVTEHLVAQVLVGGLFPGAAGAALINRIDVGRTDPVLMAEGSLVVRY